MVIQWSHCELKRDLLLLKYLKQYYFATYIMKHFNHDLLH